MEPIAAPITRKQWAEPGAVLWEAKRKRALASPAIRQPTTTSRVHRQLADRIAWDPATRRSRTMCRVRRPAMTALPGRTAIRQTLQAATTLRRPTVSGTARTTRRLRGHRSRIRLTARERHSPQLLRPDRRRRGATRKAARIAAIRLRLGMAQRLRCRVRRPTTRTTQPRRTRLPEPTALAIPTPTEAAAVAIRPVRAIPPDAATDRLRATPRDVATARLRLTLRETTGRASRTAVGTLARTPHPTPQAVATTVAVEAVVTVAAGAVTAVVVGTDSQQRI